MVGPILDLLRAERPARRFFLAHAQSSLGTGAAYVALLLLAYERLESPWAISLILLAEFVPGMFLGPVFGAAADRWSRRSCTIVADVVRAVAFVAIAFADGFGATLGLALLAGVGTGLFTPAAMAGLPSLVRKDRLPAATSLYGVLADLGYTVGPALAALGLLIASPEAVLLANGVTFALSALLLVGLPFGDRPPWNRREKRRSLLADARDGSRTIIGMPGVRTVILSSSAIILFAGLFNVAEFLLATQELGAGNSAFSVLVGVFGLGVGVGSLVGARGGTMNVLKRRYVTGLALTGVGFLGAGLAPGYAIAAGTFAVAGFGNGLVLVHERLLLQSAVHDGLLGRVFGLKDATTAWGFGLAFAAGGALVSLLGTRELLVISGIGALLVALISWLALARTWTTDALEEEPVVDGLPVESRERAGPVAGIAG
jgi:MFS family permease